MIIKDIVDLFLNSSHFNRKLTSEKTKFDYKNHLLFFITKFGDYHAIQATKNHFVQKIEDLVYDMEHTPRKAGYFLAVIKSFASWANRYGYLDNAKIKHIRYKSHKKPKENYWSEEQIDYVFSVVPADLQDFMMFALETGLRRVDLIRLQWHDLKEIKGRYHFVVEQSKTKQMVYIAVTNRLLDYIAKMPRISDYVLTRHGTPWNEEKFSCLWKRLKKKHKISQSPHGLRKATVRRLIEADATIPQISATLGWSLSSVTKMLEDHYFVQKTTVSHIAIEKLNKKREIEPA